MQEKQNDIHVCQKSSKIDYNSYYFEIMKMEYEHENARRTSLESRAGILFGFIGAIVVYSSQLCSLSVLDQVCKRGCIWYSFELILTCTYFVCLFFCIWQTWKVIVPKENYIFDLTKLLDNDSSANLSEDRY